jgi:hypothetical protein
MSADAAWDSQADRKPGAAYALRMLVLALARAAARDFLQQSKTGAPVDYDDGLGPPCGQSPNRALRAAVNSDGMEGSQDDQKLGRPKHNAAD